MRSRVPPEERDPSLRYYYRHREERLAYARRKREADREGARRQWREWIKTHPDARDRYKRENPKYSHYGLLGHLAEVEERGGKCEECAFSNPLAIAIHHEKDGRKRLLCFNCHQILHSKRRLEKTNTSHPKIKQLIEGDPG